jgi:hypothetical protein
MNVDNDTESELPLHRDSVIYALAGAVWSLLILFQSSVDNVGWVANTGWTSVFVFWPFVCGIPLLFVFAYSRFLFASPAQERRIHNAAALNFVGITVSAIIFMFLSAFWKNPLRDRDDSVYVIFIPIAVLVVFLVVATLLLLKNKSTLVGLTSVLIWPYWLVFALLFVGRWFQQTGIYATSCFFWFTVPVLLAFAAGAVSSRPKVAHVAALTGLVGAPWLYWHFMTESGLGNVWLIFNVPANELRMFSYSTLAYALLAILSVALLAIAVTTASLRLLPSKWLLRGTPVRERTWPAFAVSFLLLAVWFRQSVMPYRIPGAVDYSDYPFFQILHVEKHGLQFREMCVSLSGRVNRPMSVGFSWDDRRLFEYRFEEKGASGGQLPEPLVGRVQAFLRIKDGRKQSDTVKPIRAWNADAWYVKAGSGLRIYGTPTGSPPPPEITALFRDLDQLPRSSVRQSQLRDVCLGSCFDALSSMGYLYENHRCFNDGHGLVCR